MYFKTTSGFSLIEVLLSFMLLAVALFGLDVMEVAALRANRHAYFMSVAANQMDNMTARLQALAAMPGLSEQVARWNQENVALLPQGWGVVEGGFPDYSLVLFWGDINHTECKKLQSGDAGCLRTIVVV